MPRTVAFNTWYQVPQRHKNRKIFTRYMVRSKNDQLSTGDCITFCASGGILGRRIAKVVIQLQVNDNGEHMIDYPPGYHPSDFDRLALSVFDHLHGRRLGKFMQLHAGDP
jgi:hypothetical protein